MKKFLCVAIMMLSSFAVGSSKAACNVPQEVVRTDLELLLASLTPEGQSKRDNQRINDDLAAGRESDPNYSHLDLYNSYVLNPRKHGLVVGNEDTYFAEIDRLHNILLETDENKAYMHENSERVFKNYKIPKLKESLRQEFLSKDFKPVTIINKIKHVILNHYAPIREHELDIVLQGNDNYKRVVLNACADIQLSYDYYMTVHGGLTQIESRFMSDFYIDVFLKKYLPGLIDIVKYEIAKD